MEVKIKEAKKETYIFCIRLIYRNVLAFSASSIVFVLSSCCWHCNVVVLFSASHQ